MSDHEEYKETWFIVPRSILDIPNLKLCHLKVFETIFQFWNKNRKCFLSNPEISRRTGIAITQVKQAILFFEQHKELERIQIGLKRYLMQPLKIVEIPGLELVQKEVAPNEATCTKDTQVAPNRATCGPKQGQVVAPNRATEIKNLNKETKKDKTPISPKRGKVPFCLFSLESMLNDNPHNLTAEEISEWEDNRIGKHRSPITERAWKRNNRVLSELVSKGLRLSEVVDRMLSAEWRGVELSYFEKELAKVNHTPVIKPVDDRQLREQLKQQAIEREQREQEAKRKEIEASKGGLAKISSMGGYKEAQEKANREMKDKGMTPTEYYAHVLEQAKKQNNG
jgi:hypothetical protein